MLLRLPPHSRLKLAHRCINHQESEVGFACSCNHVWHKVTMARGIKDGKAGPVGVEFVHGDIDRYSTFSLVRALVENPSECE